MRAHCYHLSCFKFWLHHDCTSKFYCLIHPICYSLASGDPWHKDSASFEFYKNMQGQMRDFTRLWIYCCKQERVTGLLTLFRGSRARIYLTLHSTFFFTILQHISDPNAILSTTKQCFYTSIVNLNARGLFIYLLGNFFAVI